MKVWVAVVLFFSSSALALKVKDGQVIFDKLADYKFCQTKDYSGTWCHEALERWVEKNPKDAFQAGKLTRLHMSHWSAIPFFSKAFSNKQGNCADSDVHLSVASALALPESNAEVITQAKKIAFETCVGDLTTYLKENLEFNSYVAKNACAELLKVNALKGLKKKKCQKQVSK